MPTIINIHRSLLLRGSTLRYIHRLQLYNNTSISDNVVCVRVCFFITFFVGWAGDGFLFEGRGGRRAFVVISSSLSSRHPLLSLSSTLSIFMQHQEVCNGQGTFVQWRLKYYGTHNNTTPHNIIFALEVFLASQHSRKRGHAPS